MLYVQEQVEPDYKKANWGDLLDRNFSRLMQENENAETLVGRVLADQAGDGSAYYQIVGENRSAVHIQLCVNIGDDWVSRHWGNGGRISKKSAMSFLVSKGRRF